MKHWTEPNGTFLIHIPTEWHYLNPAVEGGKEEPPYGFEPYEGAIGCFQISAYPLSELAPKLGRSNPTGVTELRWRASRMDDSEFACHMFFGALADQGLIGKYIYKITLCNDIRIRQQLKVVKRVLNSVVVVPKADRALAAKLDKFDRFNGALAASYDLLNSAIESFSLIEIIVLSANQIDAFLRLSIVLATQTRDKTNDIDVRYLFQQESERGILERKVFQDALSYGVIEQHTFDSLATLYKNRNRVVHRYIISNIKTRDIVDIALHYVEAAEQMRLVLREFEDSQNGSDYGIYGKRFKRASTHDEQAIRNLHADVNDKHLLQKLSRRISTGRT